MPTRPPLAAVVNDGAYEEEGVGGEILDVLEVQVDLCIRSRSTFANVAGVGEGLLWVVKKAEVPRST